jgi:histone H3/H4
MAEVAPPAAPKETEQKDKSLVVKNAVGDWIRAKGFKVSGDLYEEDALNGVLKGIIDRACKRCEQNGRKTVMKQDL